MTEHVAIENIQRVFMQGARDLHVLRGASLALADGVGTAGQKMLAHQLPHPHLHRQSQQGRLMRPPMRKRTRVSALA